MLSWHWPFMFALLPLPIIVRWLIAARDVKAGNTQTNAFAAGAIRVPFYDTLQRLDQERSIKPTSNWLPALLLWIIWLCLISSTARPIWVGEPINLPQERRDLMLAVDISKSMQADDMLVNNQYTSRIAAVKAVVGDFVQQRSGDRLGLILFGEQGYLQTPLTHDSTTVNKQLQEAQLGFAGNATAIGDAIGLAVKKLRNRPAESRVLILLTDGANTAGTDPIEAASIAAEAEIRIHTIGVGADSKVSRDFFGRARQTNPSADLDERTLNIIAKKTGGQYFRARDPQELHSIYAELDRLEPIPEDQTFRPNRSLTHWPISIALLLAIILALVVRKVR